MMVMLILYGITHRELEQAGLVLRVQRLRAYLVSETFGAMPPGGTGAAPCAAKPRRCAENKPAVHAWQCGHSENHIGKKGADKMDDDRECLPRASVGNFVETPSRFFFEYSTENRMMAHRVLKHAPPGIAHTIR